ncbi:hypothetical protein [Tenacibaculum agarivorans]|uniref:hypothetical protein n=1 Tax=Tenacibaculum agarivorans TaxID=1908389 RepID=UPI00117F833A|nr:hypothetical protein [Tenacibaculum agarivorans]
MKTSILKLGKSLNKTQQKRISGGFRFTFCNSDHDCPSCEGTGCPVGSVICYTCVSNICIGNC